MAGSMVPAFANFTMLVGLMAYALRKPVKEMVSSRHDTLKHDVDAVAKQLREAQAKHEEFSARLKSLDGELETMRAEGWQEAKRVREQIVSGAKKHAEQIVADARASEKSMMSELQLELRRELGERVLVKAEKLLRDRLTGEDRARIRNDFSRQIEGKMTEGMR